MTSKGLHHGPNFVALQTTDEMPAQLQIEQLLLLGQSFLNAAFPEITLTKLSHATHGGGRVPLADGQKAWMREGGQAGAPANAQRTNRSRVQMNV